jgi:hypothetical protein
VQTRFLDFSPLIVTEMSIDDTACNVPINITMNLLTVSGGSRYECLKRCTMSSTLQINTAMNKITVYNNHAVLISLTIKLLVNEKEAPTLEISSIRSGAEDRKFSPGSTVSIAVFIFLRSSDSESLTQETGQLFIDDYCS